MLKTRNGHIIMSTILAIMGGWVITVQKTDGSGYYVITALKVTPEAWYMAWQFDYVYQWWDWVIQTGQRYTLFLEYHLEFTPEEVTNYVNWLRDVLPIIRTTPKAWKAIYYKAYAFSSVEKYRENQWK